MTDLRAEKVARLAEVLPPVEIEGDAAEDGAGDVLVIGWGSTYGSIKAGAEAARADGLRVGHAHLRWLNPLPRGLEDAIGRYRRVLVPELNAGQLVKVLRERFLVPAESLSKVQGLPLTTREIAAAIADLAAESTDGT